jgi:hypothetical protein
MTVLGNPRKAIKIGFSFYPIDFNKKYSCPYFHFQVHIQVCVKAAQGLQIGSHDLAIRMNRGEGKTLGLSSRNYRPSFPS